MSQDQFLDLLNRQIQGRLSPDEKRFLEKLIDESPQNQVLYRFITNKTNLSSKGWRKA